MVKNFLLRQWRDLIYEDDRERSWRAVQEYIVGIKDSFKIEFRVKHKDGTLLHILSKVHIVRGDYGKPLRFIGVNSDISLGGITLYENLSDRGNREQGRCSKSY